MEKKWNKSNKLMPKLSYEICWLIHDIIIFFMSKKNSFQ